MHVPVQLRFSQRSTRWAGAAASVALPVADEHRQLHIYGRAAGYLVALMDDAGGPDG